MTFIYYYLLFISFWFALKSMLTLWKCRFLFSYSIYFVFNYLSLICKQIKQSISRQPPPTMDYCGFSNSHSLEMIRCRPYVTLPASTVTMVISIMTEICAIKEVISMMCVHTNRECHKVNIVRSNRMDLLWKVTELRGIYYKNLKPFNDLIHFLNSNSFL